jgi:predicted O-linked N-acetylglucosamine transferase (SPINDLY family)
MSYKPNDSQLNIKLAQRLFFEGKLKQAKHICSCILSAGEENSEACYLLAIIEDTYGNHESAMQFISKAINNNPSSAKYHYSLGIIYNNLKRIEEAIVSFTKAIHLDPSFAEAHYNLGNVLKNLDRYDEAIRYYKKATKIKPGFAMAYSNLGNAFIKKGELEKGLLAYQKALHLKPDNVETLCSLGNAYKKMGHYKEALDFYQRALAIRPDHAEICNSLGNVYSDNLYMDKAVTFYQKALSINPEYAEAHYNLGTALMRLGHLDEAIINLRKALSCKPDYIKAHSNLLFFLNYIPNISQKEIFQEATSWDIQQAKKLAEIEPTYSNKIKNKGKLKIGYVSSDFRNHSVSVFFEPFIKARNKEKFEIFCYANVKQPDDVTERLKMESDHWSSIAEKNDRVVADEILQDEIDILVDLAGHTANHRLSVFMYKPAPIQVTWLGYPNTTGIRAIGYRFTDPITDPIGEGDDLHSEKLVRLPHTFFCFQPTADSPDVVESPIKKTGHITFGSVNNLLKVNTEVIAVWSEILNRLPGSRLLMIGRDFMQESIKNRFVDLFASQGIKTNRIEMIPSVPHSEFLAIHGRIDIALDPFPYNGQTATCNSLWMGVPVITLRGKNHVARVGASIMTNIGLPELIAEDQEGYVKQAITFAKNPDLLSELRLGMRARMIQSPICDTETFTKNIEEAYTKMWKTYASKEN